MKKIWILSVATALALTFSACGVGDVGGASSTPAASSSQAASSQASSAAVEAGGVEDSLGGLETYLKANASVTGTPETMRADIIGAKSGVKYKFGYNGGKDNVTLELYEFDPSSLSAAGEQVLSQVKSSGKFMLLEKEVDATLSDSGKYMAIVTDSSADDANKAYVQKVKDLVKSFKAG